jgi:opacity protein-like surface antigen
MKKLLFLFASVAIIAIAANAQIGIASVPKMKTKPYAEGSKGITFGIKAGANFYMIGGSDADDQQLDQSRKLKIGIAGGFLVNIPFSEMFSFQPELLYSTEGNLQKEGDAKITVALSYLNIPLMLQLNTTSGFYAETGPQIGFLMSAKAKVDDGTNETEDDIKDDLKSIGFSWALGVGYKLQSGFGFGARYTLGLSTLDDADTDPSKITSSGFHIGVFYMFGGNK